ncbi:MAG: DUF4129 domain-containing protein [Planctomycetota bacterium]
MNLEQVAAVIRPRRANEAVDLGFALARRFWKPTWGAFLLVFGPLYWGLWLLLGEYPALVFLIAWWLKPVLDKAPLYVLSRALFGATPSFAQTVRALPKLLWHNLGWGLTTQRLDPRRSLRLPVFELEGLRGRARGRRLALIDRRVQGTAVLLTFACHLLEYALVLAAWGLLVMVLNEEYYSGPQGFFMVFAKVGELLMRTDHDPGLRMLLVGMPWFLAVLILEPLYVAGGFALYINRRTHLEGWDIELAFRRLARRLDQDKLQRASSQRLTRVAALLCALGLGLAAPAAAQDDPLEEQPVEAPEETPAQTIQRVLEEDAFGREATRTTKQLPEGSFGDGSNGCGTCKPNSNNGCGTCGPSSGGGGVGGAGVGSGVGGLFQGMVWTVVVLAIVGFLVFLLRNWAKNASGKIGDRAPPPEVIAGLDVRPESLPPDVPDEAAQLWRAGDPVACLSLLYRGALAKLVHAHDLGLDESATEGDCLEAVRATPGTPVDYFARLTFAWQCVAYAQRPPSDDEAHQLWQGWGRAFGGRGGGRS